MWDNAQRDGRPAEYRWRPLFNAAKFGRRPLLECRAVTLPRRESRWNLLGLPQTPERISAANGLKFAILWKHVEEILLFNKFFRFSIHAVVANIRPDKVVRWCPDGDFLRFLRPVFSESRVQYISYLHFNVALGLHHVSNYGRHPICGRWD